MADTRQDPTGRYPFLTSLDMIQLEELLKTDYSGSMSRQAEEEFIDAIIEVMLKKEETSPSGRFPDVDKAWADFQTYYNVPGRKGPALPPSVPPTPSPSPAVRPLRSGRTLRRVLSAAAVVALFMTLLVAVQAAGLDVFGAMARWTDEAFHFVVAPAGDETAELRAVLRDHGISEAYAPTWIPEGFCAEKPQVSVSKKAIYISTHFSNGKKDFRVLLARFSNLECLKASSYEKDSSSVTSYSNGQQMFYIFDNLENCVATWSDGKNLTIGISGQLSIRDIKSIIDSIGG